MEPQDPVSLPLPSLPTSEDFGTPGPKPPSVQFNRALLSSSQIEHLPSPSPQFNRARHPVNHNSPPVPVQFNHALPRQRNPLSVRQEIPLPKPVMTNPFVPTSTPRSQISEPPHDSSLDQPATPVLYDDDSEDDESSISYVDDEAVEESQVESEEEEYCDHCFCEISCCRCGGYDSDDVEMLC